MFLGLNIHTINNIIYFSPLFIALGIMTLMKVRYGCWPEKNHGTNIIVHTYEACCAFFLLTIIIAAEGDIHKLHAILHTLYAVSVKIIWDSFCEIKDINSKYEKN